MTKQDKTIGSYLLSLLKPKPKRSGSEWAEQEFFLSAESSSRPGKFTPHGFQREILDAMCDDMTQRVVLMKSARIGYNIMLSAMVGYDIAENPCTTLIYSPNDKLAQLLGKTSIEPMIRDNPIVKQRLQTTANSTRKEKITFKQFHGGYLEILSAGTPNNYAQRTARKVVVDELARYETSIEGDVVDLIYKRCSDYYNNKILIGSSPTVKSRDLIGKEYEKTDKRVCKYPCPECGTKFEIIFSNLKWKKENNNVIKESVGFECKQCKMLITQKWHKWLDKRCEWEATKPEVKRSKGFLLNALMGFSPNSSWHMVVDEFLRVKDDPLALQTFTNTTLGEVWDDGIMTKADHNLLLNRKEDYAPHDISDDAYVITAGVDTQNDRLEMIVIAHGLNRERWILDRHIIFGDPSDEQVWKDLETIYDNSRYTSSRGDMGIYAMSIDSGGSRTSFVYEFCKPRLSKRIYPIKGGNSIDAKLVNKRDASRSKYNTIFFLLNVHKWKDIFDVAFNIEKKGANYLHTPNNEWFDLDFVKQLLSEYKDLDTQKWVKRYGGIRNEMLDTIIYADSALVISGVNTSKLEMEKRVLGLFEAPIVESSFELDDGI